MFRLESNEKQHCETIKHLLKIPCVLFVLLQRAGLKTLHFKVQTICSNKQKYLSKPKGYSASLVIHSVYPTNLFSCICKKLLPAIWILTIFGKLSLNSEEQTSFLALLFLYWFIKKTPEVSQKSLTIQVWFRTKKTLYKISYSIFRLRAYFRTIQNMPEQLCTNNQF